jgi:hypothetical protein
MTFRVINLISINALNNPKSQSFGSLLLSSSRDSQSRSQYVLDSGRYQVTLPAEPNRGLERPTAWR